MTQIYDFIIVGAGSAGCVLADKLTRCGRYQVLLLEAGGGDCRAWIKIPVGYGFTFSDPAVNWCYTTQPDPGLQNRQAYWPRGKVIGGSSSINAMAYMRGLPHDFDDWEAAGASGWNWRTVQAVYDALETHDETGPHGARSLRGAGPVRVTDMRDRMHPFTKNFLAAAADMGWPVLDDLNAAPAPVDGPSGGEGAGYVRSTVKNGFRWSAADAFLRPAQKRTNLTVIKNALAQKLHLQGARATGVSYRHRGTTHQATASREVILCGGAINSPQLLLLSGIGPADELKSLGAPVIHNAPQVGKGLQDHLAVSHFYWASDTTLNAELGSKFGQAMAGLRYVLTRKGPLSVPVNQCSGYVRTQPAQPPDVQIYCNPASYVTLPSGKPQIDRDNGFLLCVQPSRPTSRGEVTLRSTDPRDTPLIQPNSLSTEQDRSTAIRASRLLQELARTPAMRAVTRARRDPDILEMDDDALLQNFRDRSGTVFHPTCTCRMGDDLNTSVIDARLRVHGLSGLRVIDASSFPNITSGNTNAPTLMLATHAADMVLEDNLTPARAVS